MVRRLIDSNGLPKSFKPPAFIAHRAAEVLAELVELTPLAWLFMLPPLAYMEYVKIAHGVPMDDDHGTAAGAFLSTPVMLFFLAVFEAMGLLWAYYNYTLVTGIFMLCRPQVAKVDGMVVITEPPLAQPGAVDAHLRSHPKLMKATDLLAKLSGFEGPSENEHHRLFGAAGEKGPEMLQLSIKLQAWLLVASFVFCGASILAPDLTSILRVGPTPLAVGELVVFGQFWIVYTSLLLLVAPAIFFMFTVVSSIEGFQSEAAIKAALSAELTEPAEEAQAVGIKGPTTML